MEARVVQISSILDQGENEGIKRRKVIMDDLVAKYTTNEGSSSLAPLSYDKYIERLHTYKTHWWFGKKPDLCPLICARFGWINCGVDKISCQFCSSSLLDNDTDISLSLASGHFEFCGWKDNHSPADFMSFHTIGRLDTLKSECMSRISTLLKSVSVLEGLSVSPITQDSNCFQSNVFTDDSFKIVGELSLCGSSSESSALSVTINHLFHDKIESGIDIETIIKSILLGCCGWSFSGSSNSILHCSLCGRDAVYNGEAFDCIQEHRAYCPFINFKNNSTLPARCFDVDLDRYPGWMIDMHLLFPERYHKHGPSLITSSGNSVFDDSYFKTYQKIQNMLSL